MQPVSPEAVGTSEDDSHGMRGIEARGMSGPSPLGHMFPDSLPPNGLRCCIDSVTLDFASGEAG